VSVSLRRRATAEVPVCLPGARSSRGTRSRGCAALPHRACNAGNPRASGRPRLAGRPGRTCSQTGRSTDRDTCSRSGPNARRRSAPKVTGAARRLLGTDSVPASGAPLPRHQIAAELRWIVVLPIVRAWSNARGPTSLAPGTKPTVDATLTRHEASIVTGRSPEPRVARWKLRCQTS
jgi:hypothetical protein